jgi:light-regulated signal transduction histidine kinase (bacteriophytochrome)
MPLDLDSCAREPIHIIGHIQSHGLLFALSEPDLVVRQVSANVGTLLGTSTDAVLGAAFKSVMGTLQFDAFLARLASDDLMSANPLRVVLGHTELELDCVAHRYDGVLIVEFEHLHTEGSAKRSLQRTSASCWRAWGRRLESSSTRRWPQAKCND